MEKLKVKAVIFDLGSTLIEYEALSWDELGKICIADVRKYLVKNNFDVPDDENFHNLFEDLKAGYRKEASTSFIEWTIPQVTGKLLKKLKIDDNNGLVDKLFDVYYKPIAKRLYAYDDTKATLEKIKDKIGVIGLISNTIFPEQTHIGELKKYNIIEYFDFTIFSSTFGVRKPHSDIFYHAVNKAGFAPSECVYVGDRYLEDITGPEKIGMHAVLKIKEGREYPDDMGDAVRKIDNLSELADHIEL